MAPAGDRTGPRGKGPMTGRGLGPCNPLLSKTPTRTAPNGIGRGRGGTGRGLGRGMGRGLGKGMGLGRRSFVYNRNK